MADYGRNRDRKKCRYGRPIKAHEGESKRKRLYAYNNQLTTCMIYLFWHIIHDYKVLLVYG